MVIRQLVFSCLHRLINIHTGMTLHEDHGIMGSQLHSPRIREFPTKEATPSRVDDAPTGILPSYQRTKDYCNQLENWENTEVQENHV